MKKSFIVLIFISLSGIIFSQDINIQLDNSYISVGEWTTFSVIFSGDLDDLRKTDTVDLEIKQTGSNKSYNNINGKKTSKYIFSYQVRASKPGNFNLPVYSAVDSNGNKISSEQLVLYVEALKDDVIIDHDINSEFDTPYVKLYIDIPKRNLYVGEAIPVEIVAYFSNKYPPSVDRYPYIKTGSFLIDNGSKYTNDGDEKVINGEKWIKVVWNSHLTPLKSGELEIEIVLDSYISKSSDNSGFFTNTERKMLKTSTVLQTINVKTLPIENRPISFSGAIGDFSINDTLNISEANVGDPLTLTMDIFGEGNFQRILVPKIKDNKNNWKLYPDSSSFKGSNKSNYQGVKSFKQILSPTSEDVTFLPIFSFSYFNPIQEKYMELTTSKYPLKINPGVFNNKQSVTGIDNSFKELKQEIRHQKQKKVNYSKNVKLNPLLWITIIISTLAIILLIITNIIKSSIKRNSNNIHKKQKGILIEIERYESKENFTDALNSYRTLINLTISFKNNCNPQSITSEDIESLTIKEFIIRLDEYKYTKSVVNKNEYQKITKDLRKELKC